ncbi:polymerase [Clostridia bacterium]|nr:polymerase [Clostridia bacterium]
MEQATDSYRETMKVSVSVDRMRATVSFTPPTVQEGELQATPNQLLSVEEIKKGLEEAYISKGVQEGEIAAFVTSRNYNRDYILARGKAPVTGKSSYVEHLFEIKPSHQPKRRPDGSVDYHELGMIVSVDEGAVLACMHPEVPGTPGYTVYGDEILPKPLKPVNFAYGTNVCLSPDGKELHAEVSGHVSLQNGKVVVSNVYEIAESVGTGTGDIDYKGTVLVRGDVQEGFTISATGDIVIDGVVEGATLHAGGNIILKRGIHGNGHAHISAGGNILSKFIANAYADAGNYLEAEEILYSNVTSAVDIRVKGKNGKINGGVVRAGSSIEAGNIGSAMGVPTRVEVGVAIELKERHMELQAKVMEIYKAIEQIRPILQTYSGKATRREEITPENVKRITQLTEAFRERQALLNATKAEIKEVTKQMSESSNARILVEGTIYPDVVIGISDLGTTINTKQQHVQFKKVDGNISALMI